MIRVRPENILPLELWDLRVNDGILWDHMSSPDFGRVLGGALMKVWSGTAVTRSDGPVADRVKHFTRLYLTGGGAANVMEELRRGPWRTVHPSVDNDFGGEAGGLAVLERRGVGGWVMDLGQSTLKLSAEGRRRAWPRDFIRLPIRGGSDDPPETAQRTELRKFLTEAVKECLAVIPGPPEAIVCALPSRLDEAGVPEGSSYIGMGGDVSLLPDVLADAGLEGTEILVLNDAELAAVSAQLDPRVKAGTLVLTIGFGVGAAFLL